MVDFDAVLGEVKRTAYVGIGTFGSASVGNLLEQYVPGDNLGVASAQLLAGAGAAAVVNDRMGGSMTTGTEFDMSEAGRHIGYGVGGSGFAELADSLTESQSNQGQLVEVRSRNTRSTSQTQAATDGGNEESVENEPISVDV